MYKYSLRIAWLIGLLFPMASHGQKAWSLKECIDYALEHNIQVKQNKLNVEQYKTRVDQNKATMLPSLNGTATNNYIYGRTVDPFTNQFVDNRTQSNNFSLNSQFAVFQGFQLQNVLRQSQFDYIASKYDVEKMMNDVSVNVVTAYLQVLYNQELVNVSAAQLEASKLQLERNRKLVETGSQPKGSLLDAEAQTANEELRLITAQNQLVISNLTLLQLLDLDPSSADFMVRDPYLVADERVIESTPSEVFNYAVEKLPEIKSAEYKLRSAEKALAASYGAMSPRLFIGASIGTGYSDNRLRAIPGTQQNIVVPFGYTQSQEPVYTVTTIQQYEKTPFSDQMHDNLNKSFGFSLSIPLFNGLQTQMGIKRSRINTMNAKLNLQLAKNQLNKTIQQAVTDANASLRKYKASVKSVESLKEAFRYTEQKYNVGMVNTLDFMLGKNNMNKAEADLLQAKYDYILKCKIVDYYMGKPLAF